MAFIKKIIGLIVLLALIAAACLYVLYRSWNPSPVDEALYYNGVLLTMDSDLPEASAMLVRQDRIISVGTLDHLNSQTSASAQRIDLKGKTILPGIVDAHGHFPGSGLSAIGVDANSPPIGDKNAIADVLAALKVLAEKTPKGKWIRAFGFDDTMIADKRFITRAELDSVSSQHPIFVMHISGHMSVLNSMGLALVGYDESTPEPEGGEIVRDATGKLTGLVKESPHFLLLDKALTFSPQDALKMTRHAVEEYLSQGVTSVQAGKLDLKQLQDLAIASQFGVVPQRMVAWPDVAAKRTMLSDEISFEYRDKFKVTATKFISDGSIQGYTGYLAEPYFVIPESESADYRGYSVFGEGDAELIVELIETHKQQVAIHANGDAAIDSVLDILEPLTEVIQQHDLRPIIVHAQMARPDQIERMQRIGVTPTYFVSHVRVWGDRHKNVFMGAQRAQKIDPLRSSELSGIKFSVHMDTPVLPMQSMQMVEDAVVRKTYEGQVLGEQERISVNSALQAITINGAWQSHQEQDLGSLTAGKFADFIVLSDNPLTVDPEQISAIEVEQTYIGGALHFQK